MALVNNPHAGITREDSFPFLERVIELIESQQFFVPCQGRHALHYAPGRNRQSERQRIGQQYLGGCGFEIDDVPITLTYHGGQRVVVRIHTLDIALQQLRIARRKIESLLTLLGHPAVLRPSQQTGRNGN